MGYPQQLNSAISWTSDAPICSALHEPAWSYWGDPRRNVASQEQCVVHNLCPISPGCSLQSLLHTAGNTAPAGEARLPGPSYCPDCFFRQNPGPAAIFLRLYRMSRHRHLLGDSVPDIGSRSRQSPDHLGAGSHFLQGPWPREHMNLMGQQAQVPLRDSQKLPTTGHTVGAGLASEAIGEHGIGLGGGSLCNINGRIFCGQLFRIFPAHGPFWAFFRPERRRIPELSWPGLYPRKKGQGRQNPKGWAFCF